MATARSNGDKKATQSIPNNAADSSEDEEAPALQECFIIMPIRDPEGYAPGHFRHVFEDIFVPACKKAGYRAIRADQVVQTNLIQLDVLRRIVESPMALCDLSTQNPNVLFELGLRQAFDKPVVLVQEEGTAPIFDIAPFRYYEYRRELVYHEVLEDQRRIAGALLATRAAASSRKDVNSIVRLLELTQPASLQQVNDLEQDPTIQLVMAEIRKLRADIEPGRQTGRHQSNSIDPKTSISDRDTPAEIVLTSSGGYIIGEELFKQLRNNLRNGMSKEQSVRALAATYNLPLADALSLMERVGRDNLWRLSSRQTQWFLSPIKELEDEDSNSAS